MEKYNDNGGHQLACELVYPHIFGKENIESIDYVGSVHYANIITLDTDSQEEKMKKKLLALIRQARKDTLDLGMGIDTLIKIRTKFAGINTCVQHSIQERTVNQYHGNVCIRLLNDRGNPSEFFFWNAQYLLFMVKGTVNGEKGLLNWIWVPDCSKLIRLIQNDLIPYNVIPNPSQVSNSKFIAVDICVLKAVIPDVIVWENPEL